ncbi:MAG: NAD-dependent epimerase/dehydratase family protein [Acidimicrobiia bacterium]
MRVAVTGGTGVVGTAVVRHLVAGGHEVAGLARSGEASAKLEELGAQTVSGDLFDGDAVDALVDGAEWVFHIAGINELCTGDSDLMWQVNVEGTRRVVEACRQAGVARLVHTSSAVTIGEEQGTLGAEHSRHRGWYLSEYERSKHAAERVALTGADGLEVVVVNPSSVQGPGRATGTGSILLAAARGRLRFVIDTHLSLVDIDDCARGHLLAAERGRPGARYLLSGVSLSMEEAVDLLSKVMGRELRPRRIPPAALSVVGTLVGGVFGLLGRTAPLCREMVRVIRFGHRYDGSLATRELGLVYTPIEETLRRTLEWFRFEGLLE